MPETWAEEALSDRRRAREALIEKARSFVAEMARAGDLVAAVVYGSVARGDFNVWSDIDLLLIRSRLPARMPDRLAALADRAPAGVQALAWTPEEFTKAHRAGNPIAAEAQARGVVLHGAEARDPRLVSPLFEQLRTERNISILYTSHNMDGVTRLCDDVIFLNRGNITRKASPQELAAAEGLPAS